MNYYSDDIPSLGVACEFVSRNVWSRFGLRFINDVTMAGSRDSSAVYIRGTTINEHKDWFKQMSSELRTDFLLR